MFCRTRLKWIASVAILVLAPTGTVQPADNLAAPASPVISPEDQVLQAYQTGVLTREEAVVTYQAVTTATPANQAIALADAGVLNDDEGATLYAAAAITTGDTIYWWSYRPPIGKFGKPVGVWIIWPGDGPPTVVQLPPFTSPTPLPDPTPWPGYYTWDGKKWNFIPFPIPIF